MRVDCMFPRRKDVLADRLTGCSVAPDSITWTTRLAGFFEASVVFCWGIVLNTSFLE